MDIHDSLQEVNLLNKLTKLDRWNDLNARMLDEFLQGFESDLMSRKVWEDQYESWIKLATQVVEPKTWPWRGASNVKYPLVATAAMQFSARAYPSLVPGKEIVKAKVWGKDETMEKAKKAQRIGKHMSYQLLKQMDNWEADMDRLLYMLAIVGTVFKKTYFDSKKQVNVSRLILPRDFVVNYWATDILTAFRKTEIMYLTRNEIVERQNYGTYIKDYDPELSQYKNLTPLHLKALNNYNGASQSPDTISVTIPILEMHTWYDLDEDGYREPYIVTIDPDQKKLLRITAGYSEEGIKANGKTVLCLDQDQYYTKFTFLPTPDGGFYDLGFGSLLGPINETSNTLINQLIDSGTIYNLQGGFMAKGLRIKGGNYMFDPGEWKLVNSVSDDLRKNIMPLPVREPSSVLFQLLGTIIESGQRLASVAEIFVGKMPGQNTPATTTMATIEQGMKVFTAIYKRVYRSLDEELHKLYKLNKKFLDPEEYFRVLDSQEIQMIGISDYQGDDTDISPSADPDSTSDTEEKQKAEALMQMLQLGTIDPKWATLKMAKALRIEDIEQGMNYQPPPNPEAQKMQMEAQMKQQESQMKMQIEQMKAQLKLKEMEMEIAFKQKELELEAKSKQMELSYKQQEMGLNAQQTVLQAKMDMVTQGEQHKQKMQVNEEQHKQKMSQMEEKSKGEEKVAKRKLKLKQDQDNYTIEESK